MKWTRWTRFAWDLTRLAPAYSAIDSRYNIRQSTADDEKAVRTVVLSAFTLDSNWAFMMNGLRSQLESALDHLFQEKEPEGGRPVCLVITHGSRIIGVSVLTLRRDADNHLLTGPCVLMEYHNRGLGTALLAESLVVLRDSGVKTAYGMTVQNAPTGQFVYSKFESTSTLYPPAAPDLVAS
jgi:predicted N-acetyltransferase YhbS